MKLQSGITCYEIHHCELVKRTYLIVQSNYVNSNLLN